MSTDRNSESHGNPEPALLPKRRYGGPAMVEVGSVVAITTGHSSPVGDPPVGQGLGYFNAAIVPDDDAEVDLEGR